MRHKWAKISPNNALPAGTIQAVELLQQPQPWDNDELTIYCILLLSWRAYLLDEVGNLSGICDVEFIEGLPCKTEGILLHGLQHVTITYDCFALQHPSNFLISRWGEERCALQHLEFSWKSKEGLRVCTKWSGSLAYIDWREVGNTCGGCCCRGRIVWILVLWSLTNTLEIWKLFSASASRRLWSCLNSSTWQVVPNYWAAGIVSLLRAAFPFLPLLIIE